MTPTTRTYFSPLRMAHQSSGEPTKTHSISSDRVMTGPPHGMCPVRYFHVPANQQFGVQMPMTTTSQLGSIMVKAAWRISTSSDDPKRFYAINAQIYNPQSKTCTPSTVLLVGLHIAHKVDPFTEWVWSTFEQVD